MAASTIGGVVVAAEPGDAAPSSHSVLLMGGIDADGNVRASAPTGTGAAAEKRAGVAVADVGGFSTINAAALGYDPEDYQLRIQFTSVTGAPAQLEAMGPAGTWTRIGTATFAEDDIAHLPLRYPAVRVVWGTSGLATVSGYAA